MEKKRAIPSPNYYFHTGEEIPIRSPEEEFEKWKFHIGIEKSEEVILTEEMLKAWTKDPDRLLQCDFDGSTHPPNYSYCPRCKEYKGLSPLIPRWSYWD